MKKVLIMPVTAAVLLTAGNSGRVTSRDEAG